MSTISVSNIQDNVSDAVTGISGGGFRRSTFPILMFGKTQQTVAHLAFAVGANATSAVSGRQRPLEGVECITQIDTPCQKPYTFNSFQAFEVAKPKRLLERLT